MRMLRENCVVLDTSILPKRPSVSDIKTFMDDQLQLDMSLVTSIQPHNIKNVVYLGMQDKQAAESIASAHHLKHCMMSDGKKFFLPIYVEKSAVDVRIHDLPTNLDNLVIVDHMRQYGEVFAIKNEVWKSYFPGFVNGVRILRMKVDHPIPTYITIDDEVTLVTHRNQVKTCRNCGKTSHPKQRCSELAAMASTSAATITRATTAEAAITVAKEHNSQPNSNNDNNNTSTTFNNNKTNKPTMPIVAKEKQWPSLPKPAIEVDQKKNKKAALNKRQRSMDSDTTSNQPKKVNANDPADSDSDCSLTTVSEICPYTQLPYNTPSYEWIDDEEKKREMINQYKQRVDALYLEKQTEEVQLCK